MDIIFIVDQYYKIIDNNFFVKNNIKVIYVETQNIHNFISKNYEYYKKIFLFLNESDFYFLNSTGNLSINTNFNENYKSNWDSFLNTLPKNLSVIFLDNSPETLHPIQMEHIVYFLNSNENTYLISSRCGSINHNRSITNLIYLPLLFSFYQHNFYKYPKLYYSKPSNSKYDFITYLGQGYKTSKIDVRKNELNFFLSYDLSKTKFKEEIGFEINEDNMGPSSPGHFWNLFNSLSAKIQIIFENLFSNQVFDDYYFLTEKTMKSFITPHPYVLMLDSTIISELENFGFKFSYKCNSIVDFQNLFNNIKEDIDKWINNNKDDFYHNRDNLFEMASSTELPHHIFLEKILNNNI
jgi:hypothetical protein